MRLGVDSLRSVVMRANAPMSDTNAGSAEAFAPLAGLQSLHATYLLLEMHSKCFELSTIALSELSIVFDRLSD